MNIYNSIKVNFLNFESIKTIQDAKKEITNKNTPSYPDTHIKYKIITYTNHMYNNTRVS